MFRKRRLRQIFLSGVWLLAWSGCEENADDGGIPAIAENLEETASVASTVGANVGALSISDNQLAATYPEGLSVSAFPKTVDSSPGEAAAGTLQVKTTALLVESLPPPPPPGDHQPNSPSTGSFDPFLQHPKVRLQASKERLDGTAESCFSEEIAAALGPPPNIQEICYGFDYGMVSGDTLGMVDGGRINPALANQQDQSTASLLAALESIDGRTLPTSGEVCMVGKGRGLVKSAVARVDSALQLFQGMLCQAKKDGLASELPKEGESIDLTSAFAGFSGSSGGGMSFSDVSVSRLSDSQQHPVFKSQLTFSVDSVHGSEETKVTLVHSPGEGNVNYRGVMWIEGERISDQNNETYAVVTSVLYAKTGTDLSDQKITFEVRNANINKTRVKEDPLTSDGLVNYNAGSGSDGSFVGPGQANDYISGIGYFAFDVNPSTYAGKISFWVNPGGNYYEAARGFIFETDQKSDGTLAGCAYSGAMREGSIRKAIKESELLEPTGCYTPQHNNGVCGRANDNVGSQVWKQCFQQNTEGVYQVDAEKVSDISSGFDVLPMKPSDMPQVDLRDMATLGNVR